MVQTRPKRGTRPGCSYFELELKRQYLGRKPRKKGLREEAEEGEEAEKAEEAEEE